MSVKKKIFWPLLVLLLVGMTGMMWKVGFGASPVEEFLERHWSHPIPPQGKPPEDFSPLESSLAPTSCAQCHPSQYEQWRSSLHSHTMSAGIRWQLQLADAGTAKSCLRCHAPMSEQLALLAQERGWTRSTARPPGYVPDNLHKQGLVCAACHVRSHTRYGPEANKPIEDSGVHGGFVEHTAFEDSRFCATCHQFADDGPRLNGKLREDTYSQWRGTRFAQEGKTCQACHMPERRHLWKGIHDKEMTRSAITVRLDAKQNELGVLSARADVTNSGAAHHLPTYLVPEVILHLEHVDSAGHVSELARRIIAWRANLALNEELFDQRLVAGESITLSGESGHVEGGGKVRLRVSVAPRYHYVRTFEDYLQTNRNRLDPATLDLIRLAIQEARSTEYEFIAAVLSLPTVAK